MTFLDSYFLPGEKFVDLVVAFPSRKEFVDLAITFPSQKKNVISVLVSRNVN